MIHPDILTIIAGILIPMFGGFFWMINRMDKTCASLRNELKADITEIQQQINIIHTDLRNIDSRMSRLEGGFTERGYWESRDKKIGE